MKQHIHTLARYSGYAAVGAALISALQYVQTGDLPVAASAATLILIALTLLLRSQTAKQQPGDNPDGE